MAATSAPGSERRNGSLYGSSGPTAASTSRKNACAAPTTRTARNSRWNSKAKPGDYALHAARHLTAGKRDELEHPLIERSSAPSPCHLRLGGQTGVVLATSGHVVPPTALGTVPATGLFETTIDLGPIGASEARTVHVQALLRTSPSRFRLTPVRQVAQLGADLRLVEPVERIYVDRSAPPGGDGLSWATASHDLSLLIEALPVGGAAPTQLWLREGAYPVAPMSTTSPGPMRYGDALEVLGGFNGTEASAASGDEDFRLGSLSPCVDAGDSAQVPTWLQLDLDGLLRIVDDPLAPNVGSGGSRIVDMGAYERQ